MRHEEKLEGLSERFGFPHIPEYELSYFRDVFAAELREALEAAGPEDFAWRGRLRRLMGDAAGAAADLAKALDRDPDNARAHEWLGEAALGTPDSDASLTRAIELGAVWAKLYRGAGRLLNGDKAAGRRDLLAFLQDRPDSALGRILAGDFKRAAALAPSCSAAQLLYAREAAGDAMLRAMEGALDADPDYAHTALAQYEPGASWPTFLKRLRAFAFARNKHLPVCIRFEKEDLQWAPYHEDAVAKAEALRAAHPDSVWAMALAGRALSRLPAAAGRQAEAVALLDEAVRRAPHAGWLYAWRALARVKAGDSDGALADLAVCVEKQPFYYRAYAWRASLLRRLGRPREALAALDRAVPVDGLYPFLIHERSLARRAAGDFVGGALDLDRAFRLDQRYSWTVAVGRQPACEDDLERGIAELDAAIAAAPTTPSLRVWRGELRLRRDDLTGAFDDLSAAARLDPHHALAHAWLGAALTRSGRPREAVASLRRALALDPELWAAQGWLADAHEAAGDRAAAAAALSILLRNRPKAAWAWRQRAEARLAAGEPRAALSDVRKAVALDGRSADTWYLFAHIQETRGEFADAERAVERTLKISPDLGRAYLLRARIRLGLGRPEGVVADYRTVLEKFPYLFNAEQKAQVEALISS